MTRGIQGLCGPLRLGGTLLFGLLSGVTPRPAWSQGASYSNCVLTVSALAFGNYTSVSPVTSTANVNVTCTGIGFTEVYTIALNGGTSGSIGSRGMAGPSGPRLGYQIYTTAAYSTVWGDGTTGVTQGDTYVFLLLGVQLTNFTAYGRIPAAQSLIAGAFTDMITVTLTY